MRIAIAGLGNDKNFGDPIILESAKAVYKDVLVEHLGDNNIEWIECNLEPHSGAWRNQYANRLFHKLFHSVPWSIYIWRVLIKGLMLFWSRMYDSQVNSSKLGVIAGGGLLHYKYLDCGIGVCLFILSCARNRVPVIVNAVGVEGFDSKNTVCNLMRWCLNNDAVKAITTREETQFIEKFYINGNTEKKYYGCCYDPAIFASRLISARNEDRRNVIGIGLMRRGPFYDISANKNYSDELVSFYAFLAKKFDTGGIAYEFFTNGHDADLALKDAIEDRIGHKINVRIPKEPIQLIEIINSFSGIVAARMHALIIGYSLAKPEVGIVWHNKVAKWLSSVKADACTRIDNLDAMKVFNIIKDDFGAYYYPRGQLACMQSKHMDVVRKCVEAAIHTKGMK